MSKNITTVPSHKFVFLHQFINMDYADYDCKKRLIKIFINSVFVYDDKVVLTFNYSEDNRTITLNEIDAGLQQGIRTPSALWGQKRSCDLLRLRLLFRFVRNVRDSNKEGASVSLRKKTVRWTVFADVATSISEAIGAA